MEGFLASCINPSTQRVFSRIRTLTHDSTRPATQLKDGCDLVSNSEFTHNTNMTSSTMQVSSKEQDHVQLLTTLRLRAIAGIPLDAAKIYTDGSKGETNTTGSGVFIELPGRVIKFQRRNTDHASVFRTKPIAIMCGLSFINIIRDLAFSGIWILTDSRSSIQHLSNWPSIGDSTSRSILHLFQQLSDRHPIHRQSGKIAVH
ncbi:RNase H domain-containing protein [Trichonephila clavipes]|nr:RNase H domain-containing protein [Trichonephila clavipes]